ncbi:helix-turn-helix domain-containing protein [Paenibacillus sp. IB182496]|uniref:Helix-turn-helix domain-containing protein n=1 Tax=Paenibacillus sabuli TaxID=2772509 RepID=A0A927C070_9BACL|nr:helix-turn-helix transcriptional regulator [Paenibacillus sabuli]MBD2848498.1 helix-turn-helix domain-containing protein [Paenibacillus sabuli]
MTSKERAKLREMRLSKKLTATKVGEHVGCSYAQISQFELKEDYPMAADKIKRYKEFIMSAPIPTAEVKLKSKIKNVSLKDGTLKEGREGRGYTQTELSQILKINQSAYNLYEQGKLDVPIKLFVALSELISIEADDIVKFKYYNPYSSTKKSL